MKKKLEKKLKKLPLKMELMSQRIDMISNELEYMRESNYNRPRRRFLSPNQVLRAIIIGSAVIQFFSVMYLVFVK